MPAHATQKQIVDAYHTKAAEFNPDRIATSLGKQGKSTDEIKAETKRAEAKSKKIAQAYNQIRQQEEAIVLVEKIIKAIEQATEADGIIDGFKKVLETYKPDALQQSKDREKTESEARKQQEIAVKQRPAVSTAFDMPPAPSSWRPAPDFGGGRSSYQPSYGQGQSAGGIPPLSPTTFQSPSNQPGKPGDGKKSDKSSDKTKDKGTDKEKGKDKEATAATKGGDKKDSKKETLDRDVFKKIVPIEIALDTIKDLVKKNKKMLSELSAYLSTNFGTQDPEVVKNDAKPRMQLLSDITAQFTLIASSIKSAYRSFKDKKEQEKAYKDELKKLSEAFEKSDEVKILLASVRPLPSDPNQPYYIISDSRPVQVNVADAKAYVFYGINIKNDSDLDVLKTINENSFNYIQLLKETINSAFNLMRGNQAQQSDVPTAPVVPHQQQSQEEIAKQQKEEERILAD